MGMLIVKQGFLLFCYPRHDLTKVSKGEDDVATDNEIY